MRLSTDTLTALLDGKRAAKIRSLECLRHPPDEIHTTRTPAYRWQEINKKFGGLDHSSGHARVDGGNLTQLTSREQAML